MSDDPMGSRPRSRSPTRSLAGALALPHAPPPPPPPPLTLAGHWLIPNPTFIFQKFDIIRNGYGHLPCEMYLWTHHRVSINNHKRPGESDPGMNPHGEWNTCHSGEKFSITWCWEGDQGILKRMTYRRHPRVKHMWWPETYNGQFITTRANWEAYWHFLVEHDESFFLRPSAGSTLWTRAVEAE